MSRMTRSRKWGLYLSLMRVRNKICESLEVKRNTVRRCLAIGNVSRKTMRANKTEVMFTEILSLSSQVISFTYDMEP